MFKWTMALLVLGGMVGCLGAMGVSTMAMAKLLLALVLMSGVAILIAWPFLKSASAESMLSQDGEVRTACQQACRAHSANIKADYRSP